MLLTKAELDLAKLAPKEESRRYNLTCIAVDKAETVVTNGHYLVRVAHDGCDSANWPQAKTPVEMAAVNGNPILVNRDAAINAAKALPKRFTIPVCGHAALSADGKLHVNPLDETPQVFDSQMDGRFPNWKMVMPKKLDSQGATRKPAVVIGLDANYLATLAKYIADHATDTAGRGDVTIKLTIWDAESPVMMEAKTHDGQTVEAVLMPRRI